MALGNIMDLETKGYWINVYNRQLVYCLPVFILSRELSCDPEEKYKFLGYNDKAIKILYGMAINVIDLK